MQKVISRAQRAHRAAAKKAKEDKRHKELSDSFRRSEERRRLVKGIGQNIKEARTNRRIDWEAGPLAPRRDVGDKAETFGAVTMYDLSLPERNPEERLGSWSPIDVGDRVVITKGRDRGKIGTVDELDKKRVSVRVKDMNVIDVHVPEWIKREEGDDRTVVPASQHILLEHVKLVYPLPDPKTGVPRDVVIDRVVRPGDKSGRLIPGTNIIIPARPKVKPGDEEANEDDTKRISVDEETFEPCLLHPPMPMSVIDELRNKYSKFRIRHDWEYLQKKEQEDEREERRKQLGKTMRTPLQELAELRARQKKEQERELTEEQLAKIGEVIAQQRQRSREAVSALQAGKAPLPDIQIKNTV